MIENFISMLTKDDGQETITMPRQQAEKLMVELQEIRHTAFRVEYLEKQIDRFGKFLNDNEKEEYSYCRDGNEIDRAGDLLAHYKYQRDSAYNLLGAFCEHAVISLRAIQVIVKQCYGLTHRQIEARLDVVNDSIQEAIGILLEDRSNRWEFMARDTAELDRFLAADENRIRTIYQRIRRQRLRAGLSTEAGQLPLF